MVFYAVRKSSVLVGNRLTKDANESDVMFFRTILHAAFERATRTSLHCISDWLNGHERAQSQRKVLLKRPGHSCVGRFHAREYGRGIFRMRNSRRLTGDAAGFVMRHVVVMEELHSAPACLSAVTTWMVRKLISTKRPAHSGSSLSSESVASTSIDTFSTSSSAAGGGSGMRRPARFTVSKGACVASMV